MNVPLFRKSTWWPAILPVAAVWVCCGAGCGGAAGTGKPTGGTTVTVTYDGEPVTEAQVDLYNEQTGEGGGAQLDGQGIARFNNVVQGTYVVTIYPPPIPVESLVPTEEGPARPEIREYPDIPQKFRDSSTSPLTVEIGPSRSEYTFDLQEE